MAVRMNYSEDPFLNARLAVNAVQGMQSIHIAACVKHYALNNQETNRGTVNVEVSERAMREIYLLPLKLLLKKAKHGLSCRPIIKYVVTIVQKTITS